MDIYYAAGYMYKARILTTTTRRITNKEEIRTQANNSGYNLQSCKQFQNRDTASLPHLARKPESHKPKLNDLLNKPSSALASPEGVAKHTYDFTLS
jgi:neutral trehalase